MKDDEGILVAWCVCGKTMCMAPTKILRCCVDNAETEEEKAILSMGMEDDREITKPIFTEVIPK